MMRIELKSEAASGFRSSTNRILPTRVALIGNAQPRRCGIATYTSHSAEAFISRFPGIALDHYAMDDGFGDLVYPANVSLIPQHDVSAYVDAAEAINDSHADLIWIQHEFGIFGGPAGEYLLSLLNRTTMPVVATLHTLLTKPNADEERVFRALLARAGKLIVMAEQGRRILVEHYDVDPASIAVIPHGVPDRELIDTSVMKARLGLPQRPSVMTFGLLAPNKGIETMIAALPAIVAEQPDVLYYVLGATHPSLIRHEGEAYRDRLTALAREVGVENNIRFEDRFFDEESLLDWLQAADVYATPYSNPQQITSGALSYAVAMGKPVVATPYVHAVEILDDGHGILVPFGDSEAFAREISVLLSDDSARAALSRRAWERGRTMVWRANSERVALEFSDALSNRPAPLPANDAGKRALPATDLSAVERMTDGTGMLQHGVFDIPDRHHGYCIDDNARALILACRVTGRSKVRAEELATTYASFVQHGWNPDTKRFRNFMGYGRDWLEPVGSDDSNGRTLWSLGVAAAEGPNRAMRDWALCLFETAAPMVAEFDSPRAVGFAMLGADAILKARPDNGLARSIMTQGRDLLSALVATSRRPDWAWFEAVLAYDNARLPEALIRAGMALGDQAAIDLGIETLDWIVGKQTAPRGHFRAVGSESFNRPYAQPRQFDQQPLEAHATVDACAVAYLATRDPRWLVEARTAFDWFMGQNDLALSLATPADGGCFDGLMPTGVNRNQGAESILALQLAGCTLAALPQQGVDSSNSRIHAA